MSDTTKAGAIEFIVSQHGVDHFKPGESIAFCAVSQDDVTAARAELAALRDLIRAHELHVSILQDELAALEAALRAADAMADAMDNYAHDHDEDSWGDTEAAIDKYRAARAILNDKEPT